MQADSLDAQLHYAYELIQQGYQGEAFRVLAPLCQAYPNTAATWWLMAHAVDNPDYIRYSLEQVLRIAPYHPRAMEKLAQLQRQAVVYPPPLPPKTPVKHSSTLAWVLSTAALLLIGMSLMVAVLFYITLRRNLPELSQLLREDSQNSNQAVLYSYTPGPGTVNNGAPILVTPNPALFGDHYWQGTGDGVTMEYLAVDGRYRRFYKFPIKLYVSGGETQVWADAVYNAMQQISQVAPMVLTDNPNAADITLEILHPSQVQRRCMGFDFTRVVGCASIDYLGGITEPVIKGQALVATDTNNAYGTVLHELLHAVGVVVHSPNPNDIMYFEETTQLISRLTERDLNTLKRLYASPSYAD